MKFSSCITNSTLSKLPLEKNLETFVAAGFDGIDIPGDETQYSVARIKPILETYSGKLKIAEVTACMNPSLDLIHPELSQQQAAIDYVKSCIRTAADLDVKLTHFCFLSFEENLDIKPRTILEKRAIQAIRELVGEARDYGVTLLMEPLFRDDISLVNRCDQAVDLFAQALNTDPETFCRDNGEFGLLQDIFHMHHEEEDLLATITNYAPITKHVHVADHPRGLDFARDDSAFVKLAIQQYQAVNYENFVSFETFDPNWGPKGLKSALDTLKSYLKS